MSRAVADTHAAVWFAFNDPRLSATASRLMDEIDAAGDQIALSGISLVEIVYLIEKSRIDPTTLDRIKGLLVPGRVFLLIEVNLQIAETMRTISRAEIPDMPDRIISATAAHPGVPLITRDRMIQASSVATIW